ncbi:hypothetical protein BH24ACT26_BH24ACT26_20000 [soil metagenome]
MLYLAILVLVALAGCGRLWLQHRRDLRNTRYDIHRLKSILERVTARSLPTGVRPPIPARSTRPPSSHVLRHGHSRARRPDPWAEPLEPSRREAAKRRIEARRAARAGSAG